MTHTVLSSAARSAPVGEPARRRELVIDGRRVVVHVHGAAGPSVLALHGIPGHGGTFAALGARLAPSATLFSPDLLGFGSSADAAAGAHAAEHASTVLAVMDALELGRVHLVGFDFGGPIAVLLASRAPERVASLTIAATNLFADTPVPGPLRIARVPWLGDLFFRLAFGRLGLVGMWALATGDRAAFPLSRFWAALASGSGVRSTHTIFLASMRDLGGLYADVEGAARALRVPAVVLWGDRDPFFSVAIGERTAAALGASFQVLPGCGHFVPEERPDALAAAVLAQIRSAAP